MKHHNLLDANRDIYGRITSFETRRMYNHSRITYDPNKDNRSVYDNLDDQETYDPWGKPGCGAPLINKETGKIQTKIEGRMQWNIDGMTHSAKFRKSQPKRKIEQNLVDHHFDNRQYLKTPIPTTGILHRQSNGNGNRSNSQSPKSQISSLSSDRSDYESGNSHRLQNWSRYQPVSLDGMRTPIKANTLDLRYTNGSVPLNGAYVQSNSQILTPRGYQNYYGNDATIHANSNQYPFENTLKYLKQKNSIIF